MDSAALHLTDQEGHKREISVTKSVFTIGRDVTSELTLGDSTVSKKHARIIWSQHGWKIIDLGSANGTYLNGERLASLDTRPLADGSSIRIGKTYLVFRADAATDTPAEATSPPLLTDAAAMPQVTTMELLESNAVIVPEPGDDLFAEMVALLATESSSTNEQRDDDTSSSPAPDNTDAPTHYPDALPETEDAPQPPRAPFNRAALFDALNEEPPQDAPAPDDAPLPKRLIANRAALFDALGDDAADRHAPPNGAERPQTGAARANKPSAGRRAVSDALAALAEPVSTSGRAITWQLQGASATGDTQVYDLVDPFTIGRADHNQLIIDDATVSLRHAQLIAGDNCWYLLDLGSASGTFVNDTRLTSHTRQTLRDGSVFQLGDHCFTLQRRVWRLEIAHRSGQRQIVELNSTPFRIGAAASNNLELQDSSVESYHAELHYDDGVWRIFDRDSAGGTYVDDVSLLPDYGTPLQDSSRIVIGGTRFVVGYGMSIAATATAPRPLLSLPKPAPAPEPIVDAPVIKPAPEPEPAPEPPVVPAVSLPRRWWWQHWLWQLAASRGYTRLPYAIRMPLRRMQRVQHALRLPNIRFELVNGPLLNRLRRVPMQQSAAEPAQIVVAEPAELMLQPAALAKPSSDLLHVLLSTQMLHADPGAATALVVTVTNRSTVVDRVQIVLAGLPETWVTVTPRELALFPGERSEAHVLIRPPRGPVSLAGEHHFSVVANSAEHVQHYAGATACLVISPYMQFHLDLRPQQQSGWQRLVYRVDVVNSGNQEQVFQFQGRDDEDAMLFTFVPPEPVVPPGSTARVRVFVQRTKRQWVGAAKLHMFSITGGPKSDPTPPAPLIGRMLQQPIFSKITLIMLALLILLLLAPFVWPLFAPAAPPPPPTAEPTVVEPTLTPTVEPIIAVVPTIELPTAAPEPTLEPTAAPEPTLEPTVAVSPTVALPTEPPTPPAPTVPPPTATPVTDYVVRAGETLTLEGISTPRTSFLVWFDDRVISGGIVRPDGHFSITLTFGDETPGVHTLVVRERGGLRVLLARTCFVPDPAQ